MIEIYSTTTLLFSFRDSKRVWFHSVFSKPTNHKKMYPSANAGNWVLILHFSNHHNWVYFAFNTCETLHCCYKLETSLRCLGNFLESFIKEWIIDQSIENSTYSPCIITFLSQFFPYIYIQMVWIHSLDARKTEMTEESDCTWRVCRIFNRFAFLWFAWTSH